MQCTQFHTVGASRIGDLNESSKLLAIEIAVFGESGKRTGNVDIEPAKLTEDRQRAMIGNAHAAHPGIKINVRSSRPSGLLRSPDDPCRGIIRTDTQLHLTA